MALFAAPRRILGDDGLPVAGARVWLGSGEPDADAKAAYQLFRTAADGRLQTEGGSGSAGGGPTTAALVTAGRHRVFVRLPDADSLSEQACRDLAAARAKAPKAYLVANTPAVGHESQDVEKVRIALQVTEGFALVRDIAAAGLGQKLLSGATD
jgi:hypothetical protein